MSDSNQEKGFIKRPSKIQANGEQAICASQRKFFLAVASVNRWEDPTTISMMAWINNGNQRFSAFPLAKSPTHLIVADTADLDGDGAPEIVTGGLHAYPPYGKLSRVTIWRRTFPQP